MASVTSAPRCSTNNLTSCQHQTGAGTRAKRPTNPGCQNRKRLWVVVLAQSDVESDGPVYLIVCGYHKARLARGGGIVAAEQVTTKRRHHHFFEVEISEVAHNKAGCGGMIDAALVHVTAQDGKSYPAITAKCDECGPVVITDAREW